MPAKKIMKRKLKTAVEKIKSSPAKVRKRSMPPVVEITEFTAARSHDRGPGQVLTLGQGDVGQLGLGPDVMERARPTVVPDLSDIVDVCAGGMHTICLTSKGEVLTFGCNDEGALGRPTVEEGTETRPGKVLLDSKAVQVSAGDSHSAALLEDGRVFAWGAFRDSHGTMGLTSAGIVHQPMLMDINDKIVRIASGTDHLLMLNKQGQLYTCGCGEQGQLGRLSERVANRESRQGMNQLLVPALVKFNIKSKLEFDAIWTGSYCTYARGKGRGDVYVFGLNNYGQLGLGNVQSYFHPSLSEPFCKKNWTKISGGQHHTLALDSEGLVYALGRHDYGRLGLGENCSDVDHPTIVPLLKDKKCIDIDCGSCVSYAVTEEGELFAWGMGTNGQLGTGDEDDQYEPVKVGGKQLERRAVVAVSGGGQHSVILATSQS